MRWICLPAAALLLALALPTLAQDSPPADESDVLGAIIRQMQFDAPARIEGRLRSLDPYDAAIWLEWTRLYAGRKWYLISAEPQIKLFARDPSMMAFFRRLDPGTLLRMTVQSGPDGKRLILELEGA
jgi:hypothetical protein